MAYSHYTRRQLAFEPRDFCYELPFPYHGKLDEEILHETLALFNRHRYCGAYLDDCKVDQDGLISLYYRYEGWGEYHSFSLDVCIIWIDDMNKMALLGHICQDVHDLFEIVIRQMFLPIWSQSLGLLPIP
jgi:hypothetical protein